MAQLCLFMEMAHPECLLATLSIRPSTTVGHIRMLMHQHIGPHAELWVGTRNLPKSADPIPITSLFADTQCNLVVKKSK
jgi:hypothetical protein